MHSIKPSLLLAQVRQINQIIQCFHTVSYLNDAGYVTLSKLIFIDRPQQQPGEMLKSVELQPKMCTQYV